MLDIEVFIAECREALGGPTPVLAVRELVERIVSRPDDLVEALPHDNGVNVLARDPNLTVLGVVIPGGLPKKLSVPHDHLMWAVVGIYGGQEDNQFFRRDGDTLAETGGRSLTPRDALAMGDDTVHSIHNPLEHSALAAIHVYGGDLLGAARSMWPDPGRTEQPYDDEKVVGRGGFKRRER
jgi:predicted metal-dependent enzyme (double-stranded beta helix superfamily)